MKPNLPRRGHPHVLVLAMLVILAIQNPRLEAQSEPPQNTVPQAIFSSGGSRARVLDEGNAIPLPATPASWQTPMGTPSQAPAHPSPNNSNFQVVTASGTQPSSSTRPMRGQDASEPASLPSEKQTPLVASTKLEKTEGKPSGGTLQTFLSVVSSLAIVIGLFFGVVWCYRKTSNTANAGALPKQVINVLGRTPLAARQQLVLVRFGSKLVLVSLVQGEARTISEITDPLEVDQLVGICESSRPGSITQSFRSILTQGAAT